MRLKTDDPQDQAIAALVAFYMKERGPRASGTPTVAEITITEVFGSATGSMCMRDARNYDGPFKGLKLVSCYNSARGRAEHVLVAPDGEELHIN